MAIHLVTSGDYFTAPVAAPFTIPGWTPPAAPAGWYRAIIVRPTAGNANATLFGSGTSLFAPNSMFLSQASNLVTASVTTSSGSICPAKTGDVGLPGDGNWYMLVLQFEAYQYYGGSGLQPQGCTKIYVTKLNGGTRWCMGYNSGLTNPITSATGMQFGGLPGSTTANFVGDIYMAFGGKGNLTVAQMNQIMCGKDPIINFGLTLDFQYKCSQAALPTVANGGTIADASGNVNNATIASTGMTVVADPVFATSSVTVDQPLQVIQRKPSGVNVIPLTGAYTGTPTGVDAQVEHLGFTMRTNGISAAGQSQVTIIAPSMQLYGFPVVGASVTLGTAGQYFPVGTTVAAFDPIHNIITLSNPITTAIPNVSFIMGWGGLANSALITSLSSSGQTALNIGGEVNVYVGMTVNLPASVIAPGSTIVSANGFQIVLSSPLLATLQPGAVVTFGAGTVVTPWQTVTTGAPSGGIWSGAISGVPVGGPYVVRVRPTNYTSNTITSSCWTSTGVGIVAALNGQSLEAQGLINAALPPAVNPTGYAPFLYLFASYPGAGTAVAGVGALAMMYNLAAEYPTTPIMLLPTAAGGTSLLVSSQQSSYTVTGGPYPAGTTTISIATNATSAGLVGYYYPFAASPYFTPGTRITAATATSLTFSPGLAAALPNGTVVAVNGQAWLDTVPNGVFGNFAATLALAGGDLETVIWNQGEAEMGAATVIGGSVAAGTAIVLSGLNQLYARFQAAAGRTPQTLKMLVEITGPQMGQGAVPDANAQIVRTAEIAFAQQWAPARFAAQQTDWGCNNGRVHPYSGDPYRRSFARQALSMMFHDGKPVARGIGPQFVAFFGAGTTWIARTRQEGGTGLAVLNVDRNPDGIQISDDGFATTIPLIAVQLAGPDVIMTLARPPKAMPGFRYAAFQAITPYITLGANPITTTAGSLVCQLAVPGNTLIPGDYFCIENMTAVGGFLANFDAAVAALGGTFQCQAGTNASTIVFNAYAASATGITAATGGGSGVSFRAANYIVDNTSGLVNDNYQQGIQAMPASLSAAPTIIIPRRDRA